MDEEEEEVYLRMYGGRLKPIRAYMSVPIRGRCLSDVERDLECAANEIRRRWGYEPVSPLEVCKGIEDYNKCIGLDMEALLGCDVVCLVGERCHESRGCQLEYEAARIYGKKIKFVKI